ncbi:MAG TPA: insulinase family protein [Firmicutes bacterium]|nr:insulinase family protein [Bacillota bacterium]
MEFTKKYENGLKIVVKEMPGLYSLTVGFCVGVGSCLEDKSNNGFSHFIEHMMFKGTPKRTAFEISDSVDRIGGQINAFTSKDMTCYYAKVASVYAEQAVEILSDMLLNSLFDPQELDRERKVILEEITMGEDQPDEVCHDLIAEALYGDKGLGQTIIGTKELISKAGREDLLKFIDRFYTSENITVAFAGNIKFEEACAYVEKYFLPYLDKHHKVAELSAQECRSDYIFKVKDIEQAHICIGFEGLPLDDPDSDAYAVFSSIFGSGMSSRLFQKIREEYGMAYTVYAYPSYYVNNGYLEIYAGTNPKNIETVMSLIKEEIDNILSGGVTDAEFERGKEQRKGGTLLAQENSSVVMTNIGKYYLLLDKKYTVEEKIAAIDRVTKADVERVMRKVLDRSRASLAIVSRSKPAEDLLEKFKA